jgi:hypothetical protein
MARHFGVFAGDRGYTEPGLTSDPAELLLIFTEFNRVPALTGCGRLTGQPLTAGAIDSVQSQTQVFCTVMVDHGAGAAAATGDPRWAELNASHTRLWGPAFRSRRANRARELTWYSTADLQQMLAYLDVLGAPRGTPVPITHPDGRLSIIKGLGDPQAARIWPCKP